MLAAIAAKFADHGVSINGVNQDLKPTLKDPGYDGELQQLRLVTHMTDELTLRETVKDVCELDCVCGEPSILRKPCQAAVMGPNAMHGCGSP